MCEAELSQYEGDKYMRKTWRCRNAGGYQGGKLSKSGVGWSVPGRQDRDYEDGVKDGIEKITLRKKRRIVSDEDGDENGEEDEEDDIEGVSKGVDGGYRRRKGRLIQRKRIRLRRWSILVQVNDLTFV